MAIEVVAWKLSSGLSTEKAVHIDKTVSQMISPVRPAEAPPRADILVLSEAYDPSGKARNGYGNFNQRFDYSQIVVPYEDATPHPKGEQYMLVLIRKALEVATIPIRLDIRNAMPLQLKIPRQIT